MEQNCRTFDCVPFPLWLKKFQWCIIIARKTTEVLRVEFLLLQTLTVGLLFFQHIVPDSLSLSLSIFFWLCKYMIVPGKSDTTGFL